MNRDVSTGSLACPFACALRCAHLFACSLTSLPGSWDSEFLMPHNDLVLSHSAIAFIPSQLQTRQEIALELEETNNELREETRKEIPEEEGGKEMNSGE